MVRRWWLGSLFVAFGVAGASACGPAPSALPGVQPHVIENGTDAAGRGTLEVDGCVVLGPTSVFTQRVDRLPAVSFPLGDDPIEHARGLLDTAGTNAMGSGSSRGVWQNSVFGMPLNTVTGTQRLVRIGTLDYGFEDVSSFLPLLDADVHWEGEPNAFDGDRHLLVLDRPSCRLQEHISYNHVFKTSKSGVEWPLPITGAPLPMRTDGPTLRAEAAGLPITPLVYRFDELYPNGTAGSVGEVHHALRIVLPRNVIDSAAAVWPAVATDGTGTDPASMPMGARLRLKHTALDRLTAAAPAGTTAVLRALHRYGAVVADSGDPTHAAQPGRFGLNGEFNPSWPAGVLEAFSEVRIEDFEVVDTSCWQGTARLNVLPPPLPDC